MNGSIFTVLTSMLEQRGLQRFAFGLCADQCSAAAVRIDDGNERRDGGTIEATRAQQMREAVAMADKEACEWMR